MFGSFCWSVNIRTPTGRPRMNRSNTLAGIVVALMVMAAPVLSAPPPTASKFEIIEARYGSGTQTKDVKATLMPLRQKHFVLIDVTNESMGGDPAEGRPKELVVRTRAGKTESEQRFTEN